MTRFISKGVFSMRYQVVQKHMIRKACRIAYQQTMQIKTSRLTNDLSLEVIQVIATHMASNSKVDFTGRKAFFSIVKKVKQLIEIFKKVPQAWQQFKDLLGVTSTNAVSLVKEIDTKLGNILEEGKKKLSQAAKRSGQKYQCLNL